MGQTEREQSEGALEQGSYGQIEQANMDKVFQDLKKDWQTISKKRVLIVDDDPDIRDFARVHLMAEGFDLSEAEDGRQALLCGAKLGPDLVLLDIFMPGLNGILVCRYLKKNVKIMHPPIVVMMSRANDRSYVVEAIRAGADDYIVKPFTGESLVSKVREHMRSEVAYKAL